MVPNAKITAPKFPNQFSVTVRDELLPTSVLKRIKTHIA